jgi:carboxyl-terminal processing protease
MKAFLAGFALVLFTLNPLAAVDTASTPGPVVGIGAVIKSVDHHPVIEKLIPGNGAAKSGLKAGDRIVKIDGTSTDGLDLKQVATRLRGAAETKVRVTIVRAGGDPRTFTVKRDIVTLISSEGHPTGQ